MLYFMGTGLPLPTVFSISRRKRMTELVWLNGQFVPKSQASVNVFDHGLLYGDGLFEGIKSWDGKVFKLRQHIERFYASAHFLNINLVQTQEEMSDICIKTLAINE